MILPWFKAAITGNGLWSDFKAQLSEYPESERGKNFQKKLKSIMLMRIMAGGRVSAIHDYSQVDDKVNTLYLLDSYYPGKAKNLYISGVFEYEGYIYSLSDDLCVPVKTKIRRNPQLKANLLTGLSTNQRYHVGGDNVGQPIWIQTAKSVYFSHEHEVFVDKKAGKGSEKLMYLMKDRMRDEMDRVIKDKDELAFDQLMEDIRDSITLIGVFLAPFTGIKVELILSLLAAIPVFLQAPNADSAEERESAVAQAAMSFLIDAAMKAPAFGMKQGMRAIPKIMRAVKTRMHTQAMIAKKAPVIRLQDMEDWAEKSINIARGGTFWTATPDSWLMHFSSK